ncbi:MAG: AAA family ATPase [Candidatus Poribacteria bacterium]|nr:AAA family ATPase [Candidatus Poribacteria bacterium]
MSEAKDTQEQPKVEISVENFGPIAEANIDLRPLTVFVGPSNTGKTYFATLVYALHGAFYDLSGSGLLSLLEPEKAMNLLKELLKNLSISEGEIQDLQKKLSTKGRPFKLSDLPEEIRKRLLVIIRNRDFFRIELHEELKNCFDLNSISELISLTEEQRNEIPILLKVSDENQVYWNIKISVSDTEVKLDTSTNRGMVLLPQRWSVTESFIDENSVRIRGYTYPLRKGKYYLPAARSGIMQSHRIIASSLVTRSTRVGLEQFEIPTLSGVIADFMQKIILYDEKKRPNAEITYLAKTLESDVLAGQIHLKSSTSGYPDFRYLPQGADEEMSLNQASSMVSELAPLVLFLRSGIKPGDTLIIEEPEAHLHPGAQAGMAVILARLVRAGVKVIITTHSDWLLQEIGNLILEGLIEDKTDEPASWLLPEEVGAWHFQKDKPVKEIAFHPRRGFSPKDYHDVAEGLYNRSVNLQQKYEKQKGESRSEST